MCSSAEQARGAKLKKYLICYFKLKLALPVKGMVGLSYLYSIN
jgi:hypothetical protein